jgi:hypothetical protein
MGHQLLLRIAHYILEMVILSFFAYWQVNEEEDRRRLKEKLKDAFETSRRSYQLSEESEGQVRFELVMHSMLL